MSVEEKLDLLSNSLTQESFNVLLKYIGGLTSGSKNSVVNAVTLYVKLLSSPIAQDNNKKLTESLVHIRTHLCQNYSKSVVLNKLGFLSSFLSSLADAGVITNNYTFPEKPKTSESYELFKLEVIPKKYLNKLNPKGLSADETFNETLAKTCPSRIADRLKEHVYNFKHAKHHRGPLNDYLNFVYAESTVWYEQPKVIEGTLLIFRNDLLNKFSRHTAYGRFQNVKNAIQVLMDQNLLSKEIDLPDNLRRCTNTEKIRSDNPLLSKINIFDDRNIQSYRSTPEFLQNLADDIANNLSLLLKEARRVVYEGYHKFKNSEQVILNSESSEFLKHPELKVLRKALNGKETDVYEVASNPFSSDSRSTNLRTNNLVAYFDHFYECFLNGKSKHNIGIRFTKDVREYLGLTTSVASAMQTIITEEVGINPYSLYKVKVESNGHGQEFVLITDDGSVRLRALKPRARNSKTRTAEGSLIDLIDIQETDIDAATCLKMALEMTSRARKLSGQNELWLCSTVNGVKLPNPETFQNEFNRHRKNASKESKALYDATLKKVRTSKGIWIYLNSNGDSLKTANYFGNTVKTTLARYVPKYLSELVYRLKIRNFQIILLFMAVSQEQSPAKSLKLTPKEFRAQVEKIFDNPDLGGKLYENFKVNNTAHDMPALKHFCVSLDNLILALKYAKHGEDKSLRDDCRTAITKVSQGPIIMKQLLRQAEMKVSSLEKK